MFRFISAPRYPLKLRITLSFQLCQFMLIFPVWSLYVWIKDSRFGSQQECNHLVKYVIFFASVRATINWLRILIIIVLSLTIFMCLLSSPAILNLFKALRRMKWDEEKTSEEEESDAGVGCLSIFTSVCSFWWAPSQFPRSFPSHHTIMILTCHPSYALYFIVHAELIVCGVPL